MSKRIKIMVISVVSILLIIVAYLTFILSDIPIISYWRGVWIETAMTSGEHQWLATKFIPKFIIDDVMSKQVTITDAVDVDNVFTGVKEKSFEDEYTKLETGDLDIAGNEICSINLKNHIAIVKISGETYSGKAAIVFDPSLVKIIHTDMKGSRGENIQTFLKKGNAICGMNASGFGDPNGVGSGGTIMGASRASGKDWGVYSGTMDTIALNKENKLLVGNRPNWNRYDIRDACQFNPVLIQNGEKNVQGTAGWGLQPRTAIGQREDGTIIMIVVDGRQPGHSIGATMEDLVNEFNKYSVVNAAACDGGSSSIMAYEDELITKCSSPQNGGRYLPNAFIVQRVDDEVSDDKYNSFDSDSKVIKSKLNKKEY